MTYVVMLRARKRVKRKKKEVRQQPFSSTGRLTGKKTVQWYLCSSAMLKRLQQQHTVQLQ